jgi:hypothetical protein
VSGAVPGSAPAPASDTALATERAVDRIQTAIAQCRWVRAKNLVHEAVAADPAHPWLSAEFSRIEDQAARQERVTQQLGVVSGLINAGRYKEAKEALVRASALGNYPDCMADDLRQIDRVLDEAASTAHAESQAASRAAAQTILGTAIALGQVLGQAGAEEPRAGTRTDAGGAARGGSAMGREAGDSTRNCNIRELGGAGAGMVVVQAGRGGYTLYYVIGVPPDDVEAQKQSWMSQIPGSSCRTFASVPEARAWAAGQCRGG